MDDPSAVATFLFTDVEGSTRLWEQEPARMRQAMARHDALARRAVQAHGGRVVKMTGDGLHAAFGDGLGALGASLELQDGLAALEAEGGLALRARCGMHAGLAERRDNDYHGAAVNRAARIMSAAHGGQVLVSQAVADQLAPRLPEGVALRELGRFRLRDLARPEGLYQVVRAGLRADFPALRSLEGIPNNLPHSLSSFVGRERELAEVRSLLGRTRLLTLTGMGGLGKTRLSLQAAAEEMDAYPDGVWLAELAPVHDPRHVALAVASAMGVKEEAGRPVAEALERHVRERRLLVILDNCEHLLDECAALARRLLGASPHLRILASSREPLRMAGEATYAVPALEVPAADAPVDARALARCTAPRLFIDRARAARSDFRVDDASAPAIATICRRLDGIPLALELAAARVRTLSVEAIAARLDDRLRLLTGGDRSALPRQQTLRALIDWSHDLLGEPERALLRRLSVFVGGWTLEAAEAVAAGAPIEPRDVVDVLGRLVEKSLAEHDAEAERYRLLETVREYASGRLDESGEGDRIRDAHLACCLALARRAKPALVGPEQAAWLARLDLERENLLAAHQWAGRTPGGAQAGLQLLGYVKLYWINRGLLELALGMYVEALERPGTQARDAARSKALFEAGQLLFYMGRHGEARGTLEESLAIARELDERDLVALALQPLGGAALGQGDFEAARRFLDEALALAREGGNARELAAALNALAQLHRVGGRPDAAEPLLRQALAIARELGDRETVAIALLNLAMVGAVDGCSGEADRGVLEAMAIAAELLSQPLAQSTLEACAGLAALRGQWIPAARFFGAAEAQAGKTGLHRDPADEAFLAPLVAKARGALGASAFEAAQRAGQELAEAQATQEARAWLVQGEAVAAPFSR